MPMQFKLSAGYGQLTEVHDIPHTGIDIPMEVGTKLRSVVDGVVQNVVDYGNQNIGKGVIVRDIDGNYHIYGHLSKVFAHKGQHIHAGSDIIGLSGNSGHSTGPHLHYGIQAPDGHFIDPTSMFDQLKEVIGNKWIVDGHFFFGGQPAPGGLVDQINGLGDRALSAETSAFWRPLGHFIWDRLVELGHWTVDNIPEIMGYGTLLAGACIILGAMIGKSGMLKPLCVYVAGLTLSVLLRAGVQHG